MFLFEKNKGRRERKRKEEKRKEKREKKPKQERDTNFEQKQKQNTSFFPFQTLLFPKKVPNCGFERIISQNENFRAWFFVFEIQKNQISFWFLFFLFSTWF